MACGPVCLLPRLLPYIGVLTTGYLRLVTQPVPAHAALPKLSGAIHTEFCKGLRGELY